jgi:hypothetical protein
VGLVFFFSSAQSKTSKTNGAELTNTLVAAAISFSILIQLNLKGKYLDVGINLRAVRMFPSECEFYT